MPADFFISRTGVDSRWGQWIGKVLNDAGYTVILQDWDFRPGQDFVANMDEAMRTSTRTIAVLSRAYDQALFTVPEWTNAIARDPTGRDAVLVPVRVDNIVPEGIFKTRVYIDLVGADEEDAKRRLLDGIKREVTKHASVAFPVVTARFPGALPPVWRTPSERNPLFTGRRTELGLISERFQSKEPPPLVVILTGMGGIGKTALAVEYAHRERDYYKVVWWVRAERRETVAADFALLAERLEIAGGGDDVKVRVDAARDWLIQHDRWLLVIDDSEDSNVARLAIPPGGGGHVLITSQYTAWRRTGAVIELAPLSEVSAVDLLVRRSGQKAGDTDLKLVNALGGLPLAVELAGAFLERQGIQSGEYLERLQRHSGLPMDDVAYRPPDYRVGFNAVWAESFRLLEAESAAASDLLALSAYFAPDDIPRPALMRGAHRLPGPLAAIVNDADALADLIARPRSLSLVITSGDGFSIHRLIQAVLRESLSFGERKQWANNAMGLLDFVLPRQVADFRLWNRAGRLINHALAAAKHGVTLSTGGQTTVKLLDRGATYLVAAGGEQDEIVDARSEALQFAETLPEGPPTWLLNNQAEWLMRGDKYELAEPLLEKAIALARQQDGGDSSYLGIFWANLGALLLRRNELDRARTCLIRSLAILDRQPARANEKRATAHSLLGQVFFAQGEKEAAAGHFAEAVRSYDSALGPGSLDSITARTFLAQAQGQDPRTVMVAYQISTDSIQTEEGKLLAQEAAWREDGESLLRSAVKAGHAGAAVELAAALRSCPGGEKEAEAVLAAAAKAGDPEALYWYARELGDVGDSRAEAEIRKSITAGNIFSNYDLGLVLATDPSRREEAEAAFRNAVAAGYDIARNDLGLLLCEWPGREAEGEAALADGGRRGQARCFANLAAHLMSKGRKDEAVLALRAAARDGYLRAYGTLGFLLEEMARYSEAKTVF